MLSRVNVPRPDTMSILVKHSSKEDTAFSHKACLNLPAFINPSAIRWREQPLCPLNLIVAYARASPMDSGTTICGAPMLQSTDASPPLTMPPTLVKRLGVPSEELSQGALALLSSFISIYLPNCSKQLRSDFSLQCLSLGFYNVFKPG